MANRFLAAIGLWFLLVTLTPFVSWYAKKLAGPWALDKADVLVVLGGAAPNEGVMDISTYWRCVMVVLFYHQHPYREVIVSGRGAAPGMRDFLVFNGIPADRIRVENESRNTHENAEYTAKMLAGEKGSIVLLTSDSHMFRARRCFAREGVVFGALPVPDVIKRAGAYGARWELFAQEAGETAGIIYYWIRGWI